MNLFKYSSRPHAASKQRFFSHSFKIPLFILGITAFTGGCTTLPDPVQLRAAITHDLAIPESDIVFNSAASYGFAMGSSSSATFQEGVYIQTNKAIALYQPRSGNRVIRDVLIPFDRIKSVALSVGGALNRDQQIQVQTDLGILAIFIKENHSAFLSSIPKSEAAFSHLQTINDLPIKTDPEKFIYPVRPYNQWDYPEMPHFGRGSGIFLHFSH